MSKHEVFRMCSVCRQRKDKSELFRVVKKSNSDEFVVDIGGKINGRGAYVCKNIECVKKSIKQKSLNKSFKCNVPLVIYQQMEETFVEK